MAQPAANSGSTNIYINEHNRLVVRDDNGQEKQYKIVIRNKEGVVLQLSEVHAKKLAPIIKKILVDANMNREGVNLSLARLKGNVLSYGSEETKIKPNTYKELKKTVDKVQKTAKKTTEATDNSIDKSENKLPVLEKSRKFPFTAEDLTTAASRLKHSAKEKTEPLVDKLHTITNLFKKANPPPAKSLSEISYLLDKVIEKKGKFILKDDALHYSEKKFGISAQQKGGTSAIEALTYVCDQIREKLEGEDLSADDLFLANEILDRLSKYDWGKQALEKNKETNQELKANFVELQKQVKEKLKTPTKFSTATELYQNLTKPQSDLLPDFLLGYRMMFKSDEDFTNNSVQASKSLEMLHFLKDQADALKPKDYTPLIRFVHAWLNDDEANGKDYRNNRVEQFLREIIEGGQILSNSSKAADQLEKLLDQKLAVPTELAQDVKEGKQDWNEAADKIRKGQFSEKKHKNEYELLVRQFADDLIAIGIADLQALKLSDLDKDKPYSSAYLRQTTTASNISDFIIRQILETNPDDTHKELSIIRMKNFFIDVYELLMTEEKIGPALQVYSAFTTPAISRLKWNDDLKNFVKPVREVDFTKAESSHNLRSARANPKDYIPYLGTGLTKLTQLSEGQPTTKKEEDVVKYNESKIRNVAATKRQYQKAKQNLEGSNQLHFANILKNFRNQDSGVGSDKKDQELFTLSYTIQPKREHKAPAS